MIYYLSAAFIVAAAFPFTLYPLSLLLIRSIGKRNPVRVGQPCPAMSILVCAHNEERSIAGKIENAIAAADAYPGRTEILVYLDGCTDASEAKARGYADRIQLVVGTERRGKSCGMNALVQRATGDLLVFTDANVMLGEGALNEARACFEDPDVGCVCGNLTLVNAGQSDTAFVGAAYWRLEESIKRLESDTGSTMGADGSLFAIRRALHTPAPADIIDDMHTSLRVLLSGKRVIRGERFRAFETATVRSADEFRRKIRIACRAFNCFRHLAGPLHRMSALNLYKLYGHKVLRWLSAFNLLLGVGLLAAALLLDGRWIALASLAVAAVAAWTGAKLGIRALRKVEECLLALLATSWGVLQSLRGKRYQTWVIAASSRAAD